MSSSDQCSVQEKLSLVSYNCHGFNNGLSYLLILLDMFDVIPLQEHWLSQSQLCKLCFGGFVSTAVSGFDDSLLLQGRPFSVCAILYRECLVSSIRQISTFSHHFCAIKIRFFVGALVFSMSAYLPTIVLLPLLSFPKILWVRLQVSSLLHPTIL